MKVFFEGANDFSHSIKKIEKYLKIYAPKEVQFTTNMMEADYIISHFISHIDRTRVYDRTKKYAVLYYCRDQADEITYKDTISFFDTSQFVWTYADFHSVYPETTARIIESPLGVDTNMFTNKNMNRPYKLMTTGFISFTEAIQESLESALRKSHRVIHLGGNFIDELGFDYNVKYPHIYTNKINVSDEEVVNLLNQSEWVSGLRREEGFEFMNIEGPLCGARPICFDMNCYTKWFGDVPKYVHPCQGEELIGYITEIIERGYEPITESEKNFLLSKFSWEVVANNFWNHVMETK